MSTNNATSDADMFYKGCTLTCSTRNVSASKVYSTRTEIVWNFIGSAACFVIVSVSNVWQMHISQLVQLLASYSGLEFTTYNSPSKPALSRVPFHELNVLPLYDWSPLTEAYLSPVHSTLSGHFDCLFKQHQTREYFVCQSYSTIATQSQNLVTCRNWSVHMEGIFFLSAL